MRMRINPNLAMAMLAARIDESRKRPRLSTPKNRKYCPHCSQNLTLKTFKKHKKLFLRSDGSWAQASDTEDEHFGGSEKDGKRAVATF